MSRRGGGGANTNKGSSSSAGNRHAVAYTDGSCPNNGQAGARAGWGTYWGPSHPNNQSGRVGGAQTNHRGEFQAAKQAIQQAKSGGYASVTVRTDSELVVKTQDSYVHGWKSNGWTTKAGTAVKNQDLIRQIDTMRTQIPVKFEHVRGHSGDVGNHAADALARKGAGKH